MAKKLQILRGTTAQNDVYTGSVGELTMDTEKVEVRIHDGTTQGGKTIGSGGGASLPILTHVFSDHKLNDISWLNADTFSWQSGDVYVAAYNHLAEDCKVYAWQYAPTQGGDIGYTTTETPAVGGVLMIDSNACNITEVGSDYVVAEHYKTGEARTYQRVADSDSTAFVEGVLSTETVSGVTISFYRAEDGHKIVSADQEANIANLYGTTGVAWYYILDTENKQFKLPRTKYAFTGLRDSVGGYVKAGLPNITGEASFYLANVGSLGVNIATGAFAKAGSEKLPTATKTGTESTAVNTRFNFNASRSSSVYGNSNTVQPEATQMYLYFYVGNFEREALEQTAGITAEMFSNKADRDLNNIPSAYDYVVASQEPTSANAYTWYRKYKSGWVEQGRYYVNPDATWTLPIPMANSNYVITASYISSESTNTSQWKFMGITKTATTVTPAVSGLAQSIYICGMAA